MAKADGMCRHSLGEQFCPRTCGTCGTSTPLKIVACLLLDHSMTVHLCAGSECRIQIAPEDAKSVHLQLDRIKFTNYYDRLLVYNKLNGENGSLIYTVEFGGRMYAYTQGRLERINGTSGGNVISYTGEMLLVYGSNQMYHNNAFTATYIAGTIAHGSRDEYSRFLCLCVGQATAVPSAAPTAAPTFSPDSPAHCGHGSTDRELTTRTGMLTDGWGSYGNNVRCLIKIRPEGAKTVTLNFTQMVEQYGFTMCGSW